MTETASKDGIEFHEAYVKLFPPKPKPSFIESHAVPQNTEESNAFDNVLVAVFIVGAVLYGLVEVMLGIAGVLFALLFVVIGVFVVASLLGG